MSSSLKAAVQLSQPTVTAPEPQTIWEYLLIVLISGGGVVAIQQVIAAYKTWSQLKQTQSTQIELDRDSAVEKIVNLLQRQIDEQVEDYNTRLKDKDEYYKGELRRRSEVSQENIYNKEKTIQSLREENERLVDLLRRYQSRYGHLVEKETNTDP